MSRDISSKKRLFINLPNELKPLKQWVLWRWETLPDGAKTKVPISPVNLLRRASATEPLHWATYGMTVLLCGQQATAGIGFVFTEGDDYVGIDLDDCRNPDTGEIAAWALRDIYALNSYTEVS